MAHKYGYLTQRCEVCNAIFHSNRYHAKTCSNKCRQKKYRDEKKKAGQGSTQVETVTDVTISYLDFLLTKHVTPNTWAEDWQS